MDNRVSKGFTLLELMITIIMLAALVIVSFSVLRVVIVTWVSQETRAGVDITLDAGMEKVVRDLREATAVNSSNDQIRFTTDNTTYYIYYFYNQNDSYPPSFNQTSYQLRKTLLSGGINGTFNYGSGQVLLYSILPPPTSDLSITSNVINLDLSMKRASETIRAKTEISARNL